MWGAVAIGLRQQCIDVLTTQEVGNCGISDSEQLAFATAESRVIVTFDVDFLALHNAGMSHSGIAWCQLTKYSIGQLIAILVLVHAVYSADEMLNHVEYL
jgi:predicted nuclease of predicted toxin-antitoxin system